LNTYDVVPAEGEFNSPELHPATIVSVWSDRTATVIWDYDLPFDAERRLVSSGHVELHNLNRLS